MQELKEKASTFLNVKEYNSLYNILYEFTRDAYTHNTKLNIEKFDILPSA